MLFLLTGYSRSFFWKVDEPESDGPCCCSWQAVLHAGFEWDTNEMSVLIAAKLAGPLQGTVARIIINSIHVKGDVCPSPESSDLSNIWDIVLCYLLILKSLSLSQGADHLTLFSVQLRILPILDGQGVLYSFANTPEIRVGVAFGSGSQSQTQTELPIISSWLVSVIPWNIFQLCIQYHHSFETLLLYKLKLLKFWLQFDFMIVLSVLYSNWNRRNCS